MNKRELEIGDICQIRPDYEKFGGMLLVVTEPKPFGAMGYLMSMVNFDAVKYKDRAFLRVKFEDMEYIGKMHWIYEDNQEGDNV